MAKLEHAKLEEVILIYREGKESILGLKEYGTGDTNVTRLSYPATVKNKDDRWVIDPLLMFNNQINIHNSGFTASGPANTTLAEVYLAQMKKLEASAALSDRVDASRGGTPYSGTASSSLLW